MVASVHESQPKESQPKESVPAQEEEDSKHAAEYAEVTNKLESEA